MGKFSVPNAIDRTLTKGEKHVREDYMRIFISYYLRIALTIETAFKIKISFRDKTNHTQNANALFQS